MTFIEKYAYLEKTYGDAADFSDVRENIAAQITLTDEDCRGIFYVSFINGKTTVAPYDYHDHTVHIMIDSALLEALLQGKADPVQEYLSGSFTLEGDGEHALMLINALKQKNPAKKSRRTAGKNAHSEQ
ncbi:MAG: SCP2 sterol-binding domain-containing protein [Clostridia bacterium]|nr:SCP2 sterol-binding domain-containing protein [Clostridia bacterium]